jgi:ATP-dependent exoDNAse (exonuclease V) beta subunit
VRLRTAVEGTWLSLGGPACLEEATDLQDAEVFFQLLERLEENGHAPDLAVLEQQVARLFALPDVQADAGIQLMTIHKSKGLEFDTVIVPGLGRRPRHDDPSLLSCLERPREPGESDLLLAPIKAAGADGNAIGAYLNRLAARKGRYEDGRLLYVAATRAKRRLHLLGHVNVKDSDTGPELQPPPASTLLGSLWPAVEEEFREAFVPGDLDTVASGDTAVVLAPATGIRRLPLDWQRPAPPPALDIPLQARAPEPEEAVEFTWAGEAARHVGTVVHRMLQHCAAGLPDLTAPATQRHYQALAQQWLRALGVPGDHLDAAVAKVQEALATVAGDARGRWILDPAHQQARNEYALTGQLDGRLLHVILDRTFIDADGTRWIIDYKTGSHGGGGLEAFLDREQDRYRAQLERYALILRALDPRPIRLGLYFPLMAAWREWGFAESSG